ncbi:hypothetical protein B0O99DRAFT_589084 [Bisporella sp. PMI_857]|nr:hypothetical protein B0O99DRAFT_589084 [Bisporella sp. PMI_857]
MAGADNLFDVINWKESGSIPRPEDSPEPVTATLEKVTYNTVGSIIDPKAVPQFTAPNRIQREGSGRRPLLGIIPGGNRHNENYYQTRNHSQHLNVQNSMHYSKQFSQSPVNANFIHNQTPNPSYSSYSARSTRSGTARPRMLSATHLDTESISDPGHNEFLSLALRERLMCQSEEDEDFPLGMRGLQPGCMAFDSRARVEAAEDNTLYNFDQAPFHAHVKMQTLQRLAKFTNPMQTLAQNRLSELAIAKAQEVTFSPKDPQTAIEMLLRNKLSSSSSSYSITTSTETGQGELDRAYKFPPAGSEESSTLRSNPLYGILSNVAAEEASSAPPARGPQPLTAGPPGQRQFHPISRFGVNQIEGPYAYAGIPYNAPLGDLNPSMLKPFVPHIKPPGDFANPAYVTWKPAYTDTLCRTDAMKYYLNGLGDVNVGAVEFRELTASEKVMMARRDRLTPEERAKILRKENKIDHYEGQRRIGMSYSDFYNEYAEKLAAMHAGETSRPPRPSPLEVIKKTNPVTIEEMNSKPLHEVAAPLLEILYGSMLRNREPEKLRMSRWVRPDDRYIDSSEEGGNTSFGEDWGLGKRHI